MDRYLQIVMDSYVEDCIAGAKVVIDSKRSKMHTKYSKSYIYTNENIDGYLKLVSMSDRENALTVLASGDQAFNLITKGIMDIDTFDINLLSEFYALGLKRAMILKYSYKDFLVNMRKLEKGSGIKSEEIYSIIKGLFPFMEHHHKIFWSSLIDYDNKLRKHKWVKYNLIQLLTISDYKYHDICNNYLNNKENYDLLRSRLSKCNISFKGINAIDLPYGFNSRYDLILMSNILDYFAPYWGRDWSYKKLYEYEEKLTKLAKQNAIIFLKYIYCCFEFYDVKQLPNSKIIFRDSNFDVHEMDREKLKEISTKKGGAIDSMLLLRVK